MRGRSWGGRFKRRKSEEGRVKSENSNNPALVFLAFLTVNS
jgi:hypothetical protein